MWAQTAPVYKGEKFDLSFETPHPMYLGAIDPDGTAVEFESRWVHQGRSEEPGRPSSTSSLGRRIRRTGLLCCHRRVKRLGQIDADAATARLRTTHGRVDLLRRA